MPHLWPARVPSPSHHQAGSYHELRRRRRSFEQETLPLGIARPKESAKREGPIAPSRSLEHARPLGVRLVHNGVQQRSCYHRPLFLPASAPRLPVPARAPPFPRRRRTPAAPQHPARGRRPKGRRLSQWHSEPAASNTRPRTHSRAHATHSGTTCNSQAAPLGASSLLPPPHSSPTSCQIMPHKRTLPQDFGTSRRRRPATIAHMV